MIRVRLKTGVKEDGLIGDVYGLETGASWSSLWDDKDR